MFEATQFGYGYRPMRIVVDHVLYCTTVHRRPLDGDGWPRDCTAITLSDQTIYVTEPLAVIEARISEALRERTA